MYHWVWLGLFIFAIIFIEINLQILGASFGVLKNKVFTLQGLDSHMDPLSVSLFLPPTSYPQAPVASLSECYQHQAPGLAYQGPPPPPGMYWLGIRRKGWCSHPPRHSPLQEKRYILDGCPGRGTGPCFLRVLYSWLFRKQLPGNRLCQTRKLLNLHYPSCFSYWLIVIIHSY